MSVETEFLALLLGRPGLTALVGNRIALNAVPEGEKAPLVVYGVQHGRLLGINSELLADQCGITVQCWARGAAASDAIADEVVLAVAAAPGARAACVTDRGSSFDEELGLDGTVLTVEWWA